MKMKAFSTSDISEIESLEHSVRLLETDLQPDQTWEGLEDRARALDFSSKKLCNLKKASKICDEHKGDSADGCKLGVATKSKGIPLSD